eukprot:gene12177-biopygen15476
MPRTRGARAAEYRGSDPGSAPLLAFMNSSLEGGERPPPAERILGRGATDQVKAGTKPKESVTHGTWSLWSFHFGLRHASNWFWTGTLDARRNRECQLRKSSTNRSVPDGAPQTRANSAVHPTPPIPLPWPPAKNANTTGEGHGIEIKNRGWGLLQQPLPPRGRQTAAAVGSSGGARGGAARPSQRPPLRRHAAAGAG